MEPRSSKKKSLLPWFIVAGLLTPSVCFASDTTGAIIPVLGGLLLLCLLVGAGLAAVLRFAFHRSNAVWLLVPAFPALSVAVLMVLFHSRQDENVHAGPDLAFGGSHSVTVSKSFTKADLQRAYARIASPAFKTELSRYTSEPVSDFTFAIDLTLPASKTARRYVSISMSPQVNVNQPTYEGIMFLFSKAIIESDPAPVDHLYTEPPKLAAQQTSAR